MMRIFAIIFLIVITSGCVDAEPNSVVPAETVIPTTTIEQLPFIYSPTPVSSEIIGLPTIAGGNAEENLIAFIQENGNCSFPCILGLTPALTTQTSAEDYVSYFENGALEVNHPNNDLEISTYTGQIDRGGVGFILWENDKHVQVEMEYSSAFGKIAHILLFGVIYQQGDNSAKPLLGDLFFDTVLKSYTLMNVLNTYGLPQQVLVRADPDYPGYPSPDSKYLYRFILFYPEDGFLAEYIVERINAVDTFSGCPSKPYSIHVFAWDPNSPITLTEALELFSIYLGASIDYYTTQNFMPIDSVTSFSIQKFFSTFSAPDSQVCIQTEQIYWPTSTP